MKKNMGIRSSDSTTFVDLYSGPVHRSTKVVLSLLLMLVFFFMFRTIFYPFEASTTNKHRRNINLNVNNPVVMGVPIVGNEGNVNVEYGNRVLFEDERSNQGSQHGYQKVVPVQVQGSTDAESATTAALSSNNSNLRHQTARIQMQQQQMADSAYLMLMSNTQVDPQHTQMHHQQQPQIFVYYMPAPVRQAPQGYNMPMQQQGKGYAEVSSGASTPLAHSQVPRSGYTTTRTTHCS
ncbi:hypothetical protein Tco_1084903 [Tanacetum coccineum]